MINGKSEILNQKHETNSKSKYSKLKILSLLACQLLILGVSGIYEG